MQNNFLSRTRWLKESGGTQNKTNVLRYAATLLLLFTLSIGSAWGTSVTYQHVFNAKPSTGNNVSLSSVSWNISATNLNSYNSSNYAGVQFGTSKANGSISLTSSSAWGSSGTYNGKTKITEIRLWFNRGGSSVTPSVTIGGVSAVSDGTVVAKNSSAGSDWTKTSKVTFTPGTNGNSGVVVISASSTNAGYICCMEIDCEEPAGGGCSDPATALSISSANTATVGTNLSLTTTGGNGGSVTWSVENGTGSATVSGSTLTPVSAGTVTVTATQGENTVSGTTYCGATPTQTITISLPRYTVSFSTGTGNPTQSSIQEASGGAGITLPAGPTPACSGDGWTFIGWKETSACSSSTTAPDLLAAGSTYKPTSNCTLYAVYYKLADSNPNYFTKVTSNSTNLTSGYYVIYANGEAMNNVITSNKIAGVTQAETSSGSGIISTTTAAIIWIMYKNGTNYQLYNAAVGKYLEVTGENQLALQNSSKGFTLKAFNTSTGQVSLQSVNKTSYQFQYYSGNFSSYGSQSTAIYFYKRGGTYNSNPTCCTPLGTINGSITLTQGGNSVTISGWSYNAGSTGTTESNIDSYTVKMYKKNGASWDLVTGSTTGGAAGTQGTRTGIATDSKSVTFTGLVVESEYKFTIAAVGASDYCDIAETAITSINSTDVSSTPFKFRYSIYIDNGSGSGWAHHYIEPTANADEGSVDITLSAHTDYYQFKIAGGFSGWWGQTGDGKIPASTKWTLNGDQNVRLNTGAGGAYTFTVDYSGTTNPGVTVTFPSADQAADYKIYFDKSIINDWGSTVKYRIGNGSHNQSQNFTLVPGTDQFYVTTTPSYGSMDAWQIANNSGQTGSTSIYYTKGTNAITKSISFQQSVVTEHITIIPTTTHSTGGDGNNNNCEFYTINTPTSGMLTHTATVSATTNGSISLAYTDVNSTAQTKTATTSGLAHRTKITASAIPAAGYHINTFTVTPSGGDASDLTSGATDNHILAKDATFAATFAANNYTIDLDDQTPTTAASISSITATYNESTNLTGTVVATRPTKTNYVFGGYYTDVSGGGVKIIDEDGTVVAGVANYTDANKKWIKADDVTLYAYWKPSYTVTWMVNGSSYSAGVVAGNSNVVSGEKISAMPTAPANNAIGGCANKFMGWSKKDAGVEIKTTAYYDDLFTTVEGSPAITGTTTFYAVFADVPDEVHWEMGTIDKLGSGTSYSDYDGSHTVTGSDGESYSYTSSNVMSSSGNQFRGSSYCGRIYNTTSLGRITRIVLNYSAYAGQMKVYESDSEITNSGTTALTASISGSSNEIYTYECSGKGFFIVIQEGSNAAKANVTVYFGDATTDYMTQCDPNKAKVTYNPNGGIGGCSTGHYTKAGFRVCNTDVTKTGYDFAGWNDGTSTYAANAEYTLTTDVTFTAQWTAHPYTITYNLDGGTNHGSNPATYTIESAAITLQTPTKTAGGYEYEFTGWTDDDNSDADITTIATGSTGNRHVTAHWAQKKRVQWYVGTSVWQTTYFAASGTADLTLPNGGTPPSVPPTCGSKVFAGWTSDTPWEGEMTEGAPSVLFRAAAGTVSADAVYYAVWADAEDAPVTETYDWESATIAGWTVSSAFTRTSGQGTGTTASYAGKLDSEGTHYVRFNEQVKVTGFSFALKRTSNNNNYNARIEVSTNGTDWDSFTNGETYNMSDFGNGSYTTKSKTWNGNTAYYVRLAVYTTNAVRYVDDVSITYAGKTYSNYAIVCCNDPGLAFGQTRYSLVREDLHGNTSAEYSTIELTYSSSSPGEIRVWNQYDEDDNPDHNTKTAWQYTGANTWGTSPTTGGTAATASTHAYFAITDAANGKATFYVKNTAGNTQGQGTYRVALHQAASGNYCETVTYCWIDVTLRDKFVDAVNGNTFPNADGHGPGGAVVSTPAESARDAVKDDDCHETTRRLVGWVKETDMSTWYDATDRTSNLDDKTANITAPGSTITTTGSTWYAVWGVEQE